jgi:protein-S-isoprenylcysteine O-methyltransferase Ste14
MLKIIAFAIVSAAIIFVSWPSLRSLQSYGFYRFFAFEAILLLFLLNVGHWFYDPLAVHQIISWGLLAGSLFLAVHGFHLLRVVGRPKDQIEQTTVLVRQGAYKYIRHPLYSSLLLLGWGMFFKAPSFLGGALVAVITVSLTATAKTEEAENLQMFGDEYGVYMKTTKMFIPFLL